MTGTASRRRGHGEDAIYFDAAKNRFVGAISVGFGPGGRRIRRKVTGRTKAEVRDKLKAAHNELDRGLHTSAAYTVRQAVDDWLEGVAEVVALGDGDNYGQYGGLLSRGGEAATGLPMIISVNATVCVIGTRVSDQRFMIICTDSARRHVRDRNGVVDC